MLFQRVCIKKDINYKYTIMTQCRCLLRDVKMLSIYVIELLRKKEVKFDLPKTVLAGFNATWFFALSPMSRSTSVKAT